MLPSPVFGGEKRLLVVLARLCGHIVSADDSESHACVGALNEEPCQEINP